MSMNEDTEPRIPSPIFGPGHVVSHRQLAAARSPANSESQESDTTEEGAIVPVHIGHQRHLASLSDTQDSDVTEDGVIIPMRIGYQRLLPSTASPGLSEGQDSDTTEDGTIAPVRIGNQQHLAFARSPTQSEEHDSDVTDDGGAHTNAGGDVPGSSGLMSNERPVEDNSIRPSVIFIRRETSVETTQDVQPNNNVEIIPSSVVLVPIVTGDTNAGPSSLPDDVSVPVQRENTSNPHSLLDANPTTAGLRAVSHPTETSNSVTHEPAGTSHSLNQIAEDNSLLREQTQAETSVPVEPAFQVGINPPQNPAPPENPEPLVDQHRISRDEGLPPSKRQRMSEDSPPAIKKDPPAIVEDEEDDGITCTICFDQWTSSGEHRIVSLKCGHLFGFSCIERWIKSQKAQDRKCPTCKTKAKLTEVRNLYGHRIQMIDTTELDQLRTKAKELTREKELLVSELSYLRKSHDELQVKHREVLMEVQKLKSEKLMVQRPKKIMTLPNHRYRAQIVHTVELSKSEGCRVLAFNHFRSCIAASLPSPTHLFKEYAVKFIDAESFRARQIIPSHNRMIRDVAFSNDGKFLLSCSLDKTANVLCMDSNTIIATFKADMPLWSVAWDADNPWVAFTGSQSGVIQQFDMRSPGVELSRIVQEGTTPVASIATLPKTSSVKWPQGGLISCRLRRIFPLERTSSTSFEMHSCDIEGPFTSLRYEDSTEHVLVSTRPTDKYPRAQHMLYQVSELDRKPQFHLVQNFLGTTSLGVISRSCLMPVYDASGSVSDTIVSAYVESDSHIGLWSCASGQKIQSLPSPEITMDLCPIHTNGKNFLASLTDKKIRLFRIDVQNPT